MNTYRIIRYANEGFVDYHQGHLQTVSGNPILGCYAFIGEEQKELLSYRHQFENQHPNLIERLNHKKNVVQVTGDFPVLIKNRKLPENYDEIFINEDKDFVIIPEHPIVKNRMINGMEFPVSLDSYVEVPISYAFNQYQHLLNIYQWLKNECDVKETATVNTSIINYCECIVEVSSLEQK